MNSRERDPLCLFGKGLSLTCRLAWWLVEGLLRGAWWLSMGICGGFEERNGFRSSSTPNLVIPNLFWIPFASSHDVSRRRR